MFAAIPSWSALVALAPLVSQVLGATRTYELPIVNGDVAPDSVTRSATLVGGKFPGPLLSGHKNDRFKINVVNQLHDSTMWKSTSVHWHGMHMNRYNYADGATWVTQCPIAANHSFLYEFTTHDQAGTYWYHSHFDTQYCDGLRGPFILYDPEDPHRHLYDYDNEDTILTLADWMHYSSKNALEAGKIPPFPNSTLFNGAGRTNVTEAGLQAPLHVTNVEHGKRYRIRLLQIACNPDYSFSIDGHNMTIIEVEGTNVQPYTIDSLHILAGQRYSFILNANQKIDNYWMRSLPFPNRVPFDFKGGVHSAILRYKGAPTEGDPTSVQTPSVKPFFEPDLVPLITKRAPGVHEPGKADININLAINFNGSAENQKYLTLGGKAFENPSVPALLQILSGARDARDLMPQGNVYALPPNKVIELTLPASTVDTGGPHPIHLHGHDMYVVRSGDSDTYNWDNPIRRDTVSTGYVGSNMTVRFVTDNRGPWFLHCHIDWHLERGMAVIFAEDTARTAVQYDEDKLPDAWNDLCPIWNGLTEDQW